MFAVEHVVDTPVVLVIASNRSTRRMVRATLESAGYAVLEAPSGRIALQRLAKHAPDLVLYDLHLPDTDAVDLIGRLRALPGGASVPVLAFSGSPAALARTLSQLTSSDRRFRELVQGLDAIVWEADAASWQVSFVSQRAEAILGYPVERWLAEPDFWGQLIHPEDRARVAAIYRRATAQRSDQRCEYRAVAADGRVVWLRDIVRVVRDSRGRARQLRGVMVDITDQKRAEEKRGAAAPVPEDGGPRAASGWRRP
jgi:PAS domain S-box-containing protein